jgi:hypothetical protein
VAVGAAENVGEAAEADAYENRKHHESQRGVTETSSKKSFTDTEGE